MEQGKKRLATLVGCNYTNTRYQLHGCINDVLTMRRTLMGRFGFKRKDIVVLTDEPGSTIMPTGANIKRVLGAMIDRAEAGDVLFFHYSGHGTTIPKASSGHPQQKHDEAIVPCDFNLMTDVDFRKLVNLLPQSSSLTIVSDSCHSGGLIDKEKEQIGPTSTHSFPCYDHQATTYSWRPKFIPYESILSHLSSQSQIECPHIADHLSHLFGSDMTLKYAALSNVEEPSIVEPDDGILLSGCQADETSADVCVGGGAYGAFSNALEMALQEEEVAVKSNRQVVVSVREVLHRQGFRQHPCLYSSDSNAEAPFLWRSRVAAEENKSERS